MYGKEINNDGTKIPAIAGERVNNTKVIYMGPQRNKEGEVSSANGSNIGVIEFLQENGGSVLWKLWEPDKEWNGKSVEEQALYQQQRIAHMAKWILNENDPKKGKEDYNTMMESFDGESFLEYFEFLESHLLPKAKDREFTVKFVLNWKGQVTVPTYGTFFEKNLNDPSTLSTDPKWDTYKLPEADPVGEIEEEESF